MSGVVRPVKSSPIRTRGDGAPRALRQLSHRGPGAGDPADPRHGRQLRTWRDVHAGAGRPLHGDGARPAGPRRLGQADAATTRSVLSPAVCATSWPRWGTSARRWSASRWVAVSRCSSPTSSPSAANGSCWSRAVASAARSPAAADALAAGRASSCCRHPAPATIRDRGNAVSRWLRDPRPAARARHRRDVARATPRWPSRETRQAFIHTLRAVVDLGGQTRERDRPPLPGRGRADPHRVGRPRHHHPGRARLTRPRGHARQPARDLPRRRALPPDRGTRSSSSRSSPTSSTTTEPAEAHADLMRRPALRRKLGVVALVVASVFLDLLAVRSHHVPTGAEGM